MAKTFSMALAKWQVFRYVIFRVIDLLVTTLIEFMEDKAELKWESMILCECE